jgi:hypothetical protein
MLAGCHGGGWQRRACCVAMLLVCTASFQAAAFVQSSVCARPPGKTHAPVGRPVHAAGATTMQQREPRMLSLLHLRGGSTSHADNGGSMAEEPDGLILAGGDSSGNVDEGAPPLVLEGEDDDAAWGTSANLLSTGDSNSVQDSVDHGKAVVCGGEQDDVNGGRGSTDSENSEEEEDPMLLCWECGAKPMVECAMCGRALYCSIECQKAQWVRHREACRSLRPRDRVEGPNPPRANWEQIAYRYAAGDKAARDLVDQVSPWALEWVPTDANSLSPPPPDLRGLSLETINDRSDYRAVFQQRQRRASFLAKLDAASAGVSPRYAGRRGGRGGPDRGRRGGGLSPRRFGGRGLRGVGGLRNGDGPVEGVGLRDALPELKMNLWYNSDE